MKADDFPFRKLEELLGNRPRLVSVSVYPYEDGALRWEELLVLLALARQANPSVVLEIGTFMGFTTRALAQYLYNATIHTLDLPLDFKPETDAAAGIPKDDFHLIARRQPGREFIGKPEAARIRQHFGDSATWDFSQAAGATFFFIDGSHTYEYCKSDSENCFKLCQGKGVFLWHDCHDDHPGVVQLLHEWHQLGRNIIRIPNTHFAYWDSRRG